MPEKNIVLQLAEETPYHMGTFEYLDYIRDVQFKRRKPSTSLTTRLYFTAEELGEIELLPEPITYS